MADIGIFFGTDSGRTRKIAKLIARKLGARAEAPLNVAKAEPGDLLKYPFLILGTPTYGEGALPGLSTGAQTAGWEEFLPKLAGCDFSAQTIALYGLGEQERYPDNFLDAMGTLHQFFSAAGATLVGHSPCAGFSFKTSSAVRGDQFVGLALVLVSQDALSEERIDGWLSRLHAHLPG